MELDYLENRNALRFTNRDIEVWVKVIDVFKIGKYEKFALFDVSSLGAKIRANRKLKIGKKLALQFIFNDLAKYFLQARIIWEEGGSDEYVYGIQFEQKTRFWVKNLCKPNLKLMMFARITSI